jgi:Rod binding domain-containing protein
MSDSIISGVLSPAANGFAASAHSKDSPEKIKESATQFEALMIGQLMKSMHEGTGEGWLGTGEDQTSSSAMGMADEYFAKALASKGGLGLAQMISTSLDKRAAATSVPSISTSPIR